MPNPIIDVEVSGLDEATYDARNAEVLPLHQAHVHQILVAGQHVAGLTLFEEVYARNVVAFEEDVLVLHFYLGFEQWTEPGYERDWPFLQIFNVVDRILENEERHFMPQILRE